MKLGCAVTPTPQILAWLGPGGQRVPPGRIGNAAGNRQGLCELRVEETEGWRRYREPRRGQSTGRETLESNWVGSGEKQAGEGALELGI